MWTESIDLYCERVDTSFWAEPINALTNLAFILASVYALYIHKKEGLNNKPYIFLSIMVGFIGVGSFLFHTFANTWSSLADTIPIWSFVVLYVLFILRIIFKATWFKTLRIMTIVFVLAYLGFDLANSENSNTKLLNGSLQYAPALFFMFIFCISLYIKRRILFKYSVIAFFVFIISLTFRTFDIYLCNNINIGTHFMWHILNALMLFILLYTLHAAVKENRLNTKY